MRLAFPLRSSAAATLVDSADEVAQLDELLSFTSAPAQLQNYVDRPFLFPWPSRFSDGSYGVLYSAESFQTAVREAAHHLQRLYADGNAPPMETRRVRLRLRLRSRAEDIRRAIEPRVSREIYDPNDYAASQRFGAATRDRAEAIHYDSVRNPDGGHCAAAFTPRVVKKVETVGLAGFVWDGTNFIDTFAIEPL